MVFREQMKSKALGIFVLLSFWPWGDLQALTEEAASELDLERSTPSKALPDCPTFLDDEPTVTLNRQKIPIRLIHALEPDGRVTGFKKLRWEWDRRTDRIRFFAARDRVSGSSKAKIYAPLLHGSGLKTSSGKSMHQILSILSANRNLERRKRDSDRKNRSDIILEIHRDRSSPEVFQSQNFPEVLAESVHIPGHGGVPFLPKPWTFEQFFNWLEADWAPRKEQGYLNCPIARSTLPIFLLEFAYREPERFSKLVDGLVFLSPFHHVDLKDSLVRFEKAEREGRVQVDHEAVAWSDPLIEQAQWSYATQALKRVKVPILILLGAEDILEMPQTIRDQYARLERENPNVRVINVEGAGHDVLSWNRFHGAVSAYREIFQFFDGILKSKQGPQSP